MMAAKNSELNQVLLKIKRQSGFSSSVFSGMKLGELPETCPAPRQQKER